MRELYSHMKYIRLCQEIFQKTDLFRLNTILQGNRK